MKYYELGLQRKKEIEDGLLELMVQQAFWSITVTQLTKHLGISRKCFYDYFPDKEACLESLIDRKIQEAALYVTVSQPNAGNRMSRYIMNLEFWKEQHIFLGAIHNNHRHEVFLNRCMQHVIKEEKALHASMDTPEVKFDEDILYFCINGELGLLIRWYLRGFDTPVEVMAKKCMRLHLEPLIKA